MNLSPVARLKKTWSKVKTAKFDVLEVGTQAWVGPRRVGLSPCFASGPELLPAVLAGAGAWSRGTRPPWLGGCQSSPGPNFSQSWHHLKLWGAVSEELDRSTVMRSRQFSS